MGSSAGKVPDVEQGYKTTWPQGEDMVGEGQELELAGGRVSTGSELGSEMKDGFEMQPIEHGRPTVAHPRRSSWGRKSGSWEITPDIVAMSSRDGSREGSREGGGQGVHNRSNGESTPPGNR